jgi:hypothetical protein
MPKDNVTLAQVLDAVNNGFSAMERKMVTKDDLAALEAKMDSRMASLRTELVEFVAGKFAELRTEDFEPMKRDVASLKQTSAKVWDVFAPRLEYDDRLRIIEQKLGIPKCARGRGGAWPPPPPTTPRVA